jgi:hypothetical protein
MSNKTASPSRAYERRTSMVRKLIQQSRLEPADVVIAKKRGWYVWDHYIVYMGLIHGRMRFIANDMNGGVRYFDEHEVEKLIVQFEPTQVRKFKGNPWERQKALQRAEGEIGKKYNLISFNCEHLANYIQYTRRESPQAVNWVTSIAALVVLILLVRSSSQ